MKDMTTVNILGIDSLIYDDKENGVYTITTNGIGGPIISDSILNIAKNKFKEALKLSIAVYKLLYYKENNIYLKNI